jgi:hypothetical protein
MDEAIVAERGGFRTRAELMREAVENLLNELDFPDAPAEPLAARAGDTEAPAAGQASVATRSSFVDEMGTLLPAWERDELTLGDIAATALVPPTRAPRLVQAGAARVHDEPLLGLHNRDYVSIWAAHRLARYTSDGLIPFDDYLRRVTAAAWFFGAQLQALEARDSGRKLTVLLPTNTAKRPSAERGFQNFAVGGITHRGDGAALTATGPLFAWRAIQVEARDGLMTGLTDPGWELIRSLEGLSLDLPHAPELMERFLAYLAANAPADRGGFDHVLRVVADGPDRDALVSSFGDDHAEWTNSTASSVAQGYIARSREWGLVEPKLVDGRYWLTDVGRAAVKTFA